MVTDWEVAKLVRLGKGFENPPREADFERNTGGVGVSAKTGGERSGPLSHGAYTFHLSSAAACNTLRPWVRSAAGQQILTPVSVILSFFFFLPPPPGPHVQKNRFHLSRC